MYFMHHPAGRGGGAPFNGGQSPELCQSGGGRRWQKTNWKEIYAPADSSVERKQRTRRGGSGWRRQLRGGDRRTMAAGASRCGGDWQSAGVEETSGQAREMVAATVEWHRRRW
jgi:hypothetical protein